MLARGNKRRVALLTLTSVAWADSSTAASNSNTELYSNSVTGSGLAALSVAKNFSIAAGVMGLRMSGKKALVQTGAES